MGRAGFALQQQVRLVPAVKVCLDNTVGDLHDAAPPHGSVGENVSGATDTAHSDHPNLDWSENGKLDLGCAITP